MPTREEAIALFKTFLEKPRTKLPWLKKRPHLYDCAAGFSWITGIAPKHNIVWVHELVDLAKKNGTFVAYKKGRVPQRGDAIFYDWKGTHTRTDHVAMVLKADAHHVVAIGADQGHVREVSYLNTGYSVIMGWGKPNKYEDAAPAAETPAPIAAPTTEPAKAAKK